MENSKFQQVLLPGEEINLKSLMKESSNFITYYSHKLQAQFLMLNQAKHLKYGFKQLFFYLYFSPDKNLIVQSQIGGKLYHQEINDTFLVFSLNSPLRYIPEVDDLVIGIVKHKQGDNYIIDINSINDCQLSIYNFPGATKRNYPILQAGALVFCKIQNIPKYLPVQLSCLSGTSTKHFSTNQNELGELKNGILCNSTKITTIEKLDKICQITHKVVDKIEIAVGKNYRLWLECKGKLSREALVGMKGVIESGESMNYMLNKMENIKQVLLAMK